MVRAARTVAPQPEAAAAYEDASEAAMNAGKAKMAMKLSALAEELAGDDE